MLVISVIHIIPISFLDISFISLLSNLTFPFLLPVPHSLLFSSLSFLLFLFFQWILTLFHSLCTWVDGMTCRVWSAGEVRRGQQVLLEQGAFGKCEVPHTMGLTLGFQISHIKNRDSWSVICCRKQYKGWFWREDKGRDFCNFKNNDILRRTYEWMRAWNERASTIKRTQQYQVRREIN